MKHKTRAWRRIKYGLRPELIVLFMVIVVCFAALQVQIALNERDADNVRRHLSETGRTLETESADVKKALNTIDNRFAETDARVGTIQQAAKDTARVVETDVQKTRKEFEDQLLALHNSLVENVASTTDAMRQISGIRQSLKQDSEILVVETLYPSVKVAGSGGVGAGTVVYSAKDDSGRCHTYVVSAFHVVAGFVTEKKGVEKRDPVTVAVYQRDLKYMDDYLTDIVAYNKQHDLVLLKMRESGKCFQTARLATRKELSEVMVFTPVYAVGCPLGHSPLPSTGEITCQNKEVDDEMYWMMNAPTIYGNSGGGIFLVEGRRFTGVSAMLCVYQQFINVPVTHLGVMVPATTVYDWLDSENCQFIYDSRYTMEGCLIARWKALFRSLMIRKSTPALYDVPVRLMFGK